MSITQTSRGHFLRDDQTLNAPGTTSPEPNRTRNPPLLRSGDTSSLDHAGLDTHKPSVEGSTSSSHDPRYTQTGLAAGPFDDSHSRGATQTGDAGINSLPSAICSPGPNHPALTEPSTPAATFVADTNALPRRGPILYSGYLCLLSDSLDDIEQLRIATDNRLRALTRTEVDSDGEYRGLGLDIRSPEVARVTALADGIKKLEHEATLDLKREIRKSPLYGWVARNKGIGEKQAARLLAVIGDPYWNDLYDRPRTVSELWAYSGYSVISGSAQRRAKGVKSNWNDKAKSRAFLMAEACIKQLTGDYRKVYDAARIQYEDAVHPHDCVRCGPKGKPALAGTPLALGHQHARGLRLVAKEILKDLWLEARSIHTGEVAE